MKQNVRVHSDENVVKNATVEIRGPEDNDGNDTWLNISEMVTAIVWMPRVGDVSHITLKLLPATVTLEGLLDRDTLNAFAEHLRAAGYDVHAPNTAAAA